jgi:ribosomal protein S18 acetylase RimI-like enzyme
MLRPAEPSDAAAIARVHVASWRTTYQGLLPDAYLDAMDEDRYAGRWRRTLLDRTGRSIVLVAEEEEVIAGYASGGPERDEDDRYEGELYAIYLLREFQGRGLGRALVEAVAAALADRGVTSMVVWVLRENAGARAFYERLGGVYLRERELQLGSEGSLHLAEVSYLWEDTRATLLRPR